ncbi:DUF3592 domain-containing protein [Alloalcanivorax xenomutans]|uniref:DUF3592 domain-containing protein n=1 Tax=Alloalcanivorax xenomutans TaxID=1094342 RepID=UPI003A7FA55F
MNEAVSDTRKGSKGPGCLLNGFAAAFLLAGLAAMYFIALKPLFHYWQTDSWERVPAQVLDSRLNRSTSDGSTTYSVSARYQYQYQGRTYTSESVSLYGGSDNFDDFWQRLARRLEQARLAQQPVLAWVNPDQPEKAYLERGLRSGSLVFGFAFGGVFALVGGGLLFFFNRRAKASGNPEGGGEPIYSSNQKSGHGFLIVFGLIFVLLPAPGYQSAIEGAARGDYAMLFIFLFPLVGLLVMAGGLVGRRRYKFFGPTPLTLDPDPGQAGGQVGGEILINRIVPHSGRFNVSLSCVHQETRGSGDDRRTDTTVLWQDEQNGYIESGMRDSRVQFCFDVPGDLPPTYQRGRQSVYWQVSMKGELDGRELHRDWSIPVIQGDVGSRFTLPESHVEEDRRQREEAALASAREQIVVKRTGQGLTVTSRAGRNLGLKLGLLLFGGIFAAVGTFLLVLALDEGGMLYLMAGAFGGVGYGLVALALYMLGRSLQVVIRGDEVRSRRRWLGIPLRQRRMRLRNADQLVLDSAVRSTTNGRVQEYMNLYAQDESGRVRVAEGIAGQQAGEQLREELLRELHLV